MTSFRRADEPAGEAVRLTTYATATAALEQASPAVEPLLNKLKAWRGIATRYGKTPGGYLAGLHLRVSMIWIKDLTRTTH
ncbi:hypothetical protein ACFWNT_27415 [Streptomyces sp. NPDC058409]|uniref:hypothetical protein n=1 Tax=Streptomyces sp. NPDC058409 TaxID=3346484 RepID=UPI0036469B25